MLYEWQFLEQMLVYESRELEIILLSSSNTMISWLQQRRVGQNLDAVKLENEQKSEAMRRVKEEQAHANERLEHLEKEVQSWITGYWGLTEDSLKECTPVLLDPIRKLWKQIIHDMKSNKRPPALSGYDVFLKKTLDELVGTMRPTDIWKKKRSQFEEAQGTNAARQDAMTEQLRNDVQTMGKWLDLFISDV